MSIELRGVTKRYGHGNAPLVVHGIDFTVPAGTLATILGPSGCGKTTVLRMIAGLEAPSGGRVLIDGRDVTLLSPAERNVSMVFQSYALFPHMSVLDNVRYGLDVSGVASAEAVRRAHAAMDGVGLAGFDARLPSELSGGQQQRVALARALVLEPRVLLFDEPLSNLDARLRRSMREEIRALQRRLGLTVAYVTHDQSEALAVSDQIIVMDAGRIAQQGRTADAVRAAGQRIRGPLHGRGDAVRRPGAGRRSGAARSAVVAAAPRGACGCGAHRGEARSVAPGQPRRGRPAGPGVQERLPRRHPGADHRHGGRRCFRRLAGT
jgi:iron(III) transport system ATP-binding protein